jgi:hypothetical protein
VQIPAGTSPSDLSVVLYNGSNGAAYGTFALLSAKVTDLAHWNINAVESLSYQYTGDPALYAPDQYRSSDHDRWCSGSISASSATAWRPRSGGRPGTTSCSVVWAAT